MKYLSAPLTWLRDFAQNVQNTTTKPPAPTRYADAEHLQLSMHLIELRRRRVERRCVEKLEQWTFSAGETESSRMPEIAY